MFSRIIDDIPPVNLSWYHDALPENILDSQILTSILRYLNKTSMTT